jgi:flagellar assembly factor FliW
MENLDDRSLPSFTLVLPTALRDDYNFDIPDHVVQKLQIENPEDVKVLNIMILDTPIENSHINFMAPLLFNTKKGLMGQFVIEPKEGQNFGIADKLGEYIAKEDIS